MTVARGLVVIAGLATGCGGATNERAEHDARFVGSWTLKTDSATLQMERWDLRADGSATLTASNLDAPIEVVGKAAVSCSFGDRWSSPRPNVLDVTLRCTDAVTRTGSIEFPGDVTQNVVGSEVRIASVDGEADWQPRSGTLTLAMVRCASVGGGC